MPCPALYVSTCIQRLCTIRIGMRFSKVIPEVFFNALHAINITKNEIRCSLIDLVVTPRSDSIWALLAHSAAEDASVGFRRRCLALLAEYFPTKPETVEAAKRCLESDDKALKEIAAEILKR